MRISDDRYSSERLSLDLALRFLRHETNDGLECVHRIDTLELWDGEYVRDVDEALECAAANREELYVRWLEYSEQG